MHAKVELQVTLRIVLERPTAGVDFGLQVGSGNDYETVEKQRSHGEDLMFEGALNVKDNRSDGLPNFVGPLAQGPPANRFIYIDVGQYAGQKDTNWSRRMKIPLTSISWALLKKASKGSLILETRIAGTGKDGGPTCGTVKSVRWSRK